MENDEIINRYIHEKIMEKCWHDVQPLISEGSYITGIFACTICKDHIDEEQNPRYTSDASPRSLLDEPRDVVIREVGSDAYIEALQSVCATTMLQRMPWQVNDKALAVLETCVPNEAITATALQISTALMNTHKAHQSEGK